MLVHHCTQHINSVVFAVKCEYPSSDQFALWNILYWRSRTRLRRRHWAPSTSIWESHTVSIELLWTVPMTKVDTADGSSYAATCLAASTASPTQQPTDLRLALSSPRDRARAGGQPGQTRRHHFVRHTHLTADRGTEWISNRGTNWINRATHWHAHWVWGAVVKRSAKSSSTRKVPSSKARFTRVFVRPCRGSKIHESEQKWREVLLNF